MAVKPLQSLARALEVIEAVAAHQPVGVAELARITGEDKSALQRVLVTLRESGWIRPSGDRVTRWELTARPLVVAGQARRRNDLLARARPVLEQLREATGETAALAVPDAGRIVAVDVVESHRLVRTAPRVGMVFPSATSAAGLAMFAAMAPEEIARYDLGPVDPADPGFAADLELTRRQGWSLNAGVVHAGATSVGAAVLDAAGRPVAAIIVSAPSERLAEADHARIGRLIAGAAEDLGEHARG
jgi:IclR family acetate operon transcriptional repressor